MAGKSSYNLVSGVVFALVALVHLYRAVQAIPVRVGDSFMPVGFSWAAVVGAGLLSIWAFRSARA
jgi:hypothetical protein